MVSEAALRVGPLRHGSVAVLPNRRVRQFPMPRQASVHELMQPGDCWLSVLVSQERAMKLRFGVLCSQSASEGLSLRAPGAAGARRGYRTPEQRSQSLVLIARNVIYPGTLCGTPAFFSRSQGPEVIAAKPAVAALFFFCRSIESVKANPEAMMVSVLHQ